MSVLSIERVTYTYSGSDRPALRDISLEVQPGELVVLAGPSASGKSTLLGIASGLVPHFHGGEFAGRAEVVGMDIRDHGPGELARGVGTLFQDPETQVVMGTPRAELAFPLENRGLADASVARGVEEVALALGIPHLLDRPTAELSGGELQRVALGAALAGRPRLLVLDEPTSQLDPVAGDELITLLRRLNEDFDVAIILAEHRLERCLAGADRVLALLDGRLACDKAPEGFLAWASEQDPALLTPGAVLLKGLGLQPRPGVKAARASIRSHLHQDLDDRSDLYGPLDRPGAQTNAPALKLDNVWHEIRNGPAILKGVSLTVNPGERVALMGRNGAGKSTLLRHAAGLMQPTRGRIRIGGRVALLLQNPTDYLIHETVSEEASDDALRAVGLEPGARHPRDLSVGEKQRLALAIVLGGEPPAVLCLDEPTRGMDRRNKATLAALIRETDAAVLVATHDPEFVAAFADRVVLLADGAPVADGATPELLAGGTYFATETARILPGALTPEQALGALTGEKEEVPA